MNEPQQVPQGVADVYREKGLRYLKRFDGNSYNMCVTAFASAITHAWRKYPDIPSLPNVSIFDEIPNAFEGGDWKDAAGPTGWSRGPRVVNFVFAAGLRHEILEHPGKYGATPAEWKPYFPTVPTTIGEYARQATAKHSLDYREIPVNDRLEGALSGAKGRKNLTVALVDPQTVPIPRYECVKILDDLWWEGTALLLPCDGAAAEWNVGTEQEVKRRFPVISQLKAPNYQAPIRTAEELHTSLDVALSELRAAVTRTETQNKKKRALDYIQEQGLYRDVSADPERHTSTLPHGND
jgi:hypothetical protein